MYYRTYVKMWYVCTMYVYTYIGITYCTYIQACCTYIVHHVLFLLFIRCVQNCTDVETMYEHFTK